MSCPGSVEVKVKLDTHGVPGTLERIHDGGNRGQRGLRRRLRCGDGGDGDGRFVYALTEIGIQVRDALPAVETRA